jgi:ribonuclease HI
LLYADGAARGNPGPAAYGFVLDDPDGVPRVAAGASLGTATNNVAEYRALIAGLECALDHGASALEVRMDSELVVRQMGGIYRVKNEGLKPLFAEAQALARRFERFTIRHVPREQNARADAEANKALDAPPPRVRFLGQSAVSVTVTVARRLSEMRFENRPVEVVGVPGAVAIPRTVDVTVFGPPEIVRALKADQVVPRADLTKVTGLDLKDQRRGSVAVKLSVELVHEEVRCLGHPIGGGRSAQFGPLSGRHVVVGDERTPRAARLQVRPPGQELHGGHAFIASRSPRMAGVHPQGSTRRPAPPAPCVSARSLGRRRTGLCPAAGDKSSTDTPDETKISPNTLT